MAPRNPAPGASQPEGQASPLLAPLRYRKRSLWILAFYLPILVIPWVVTCVMMVRPLSSRSYYQNRSGMSRPDLSDLLAALRVTGVFEKIQAVLAIPIVSGLLAEAAVVYSQRRGPSQKLSVRQLLALADRPWADAASYFKSSSDMGSHLIMASGLFILLIAATPAIQGLLVQYEAISVMSCADTPFTGCNPDAFPEVVGFDAEPSDIQNMPMALAVHRVQDKLRSVSPEDVQLHLWPEGINDADQPARSMFLWYTYTSGASYFVSALPNGTTTGVLREHAMRMNSSSACVNAPRSAYPQTCSGNRPFTTSFTAADVIEISICALGDYGSSPWSRSRDRQDISEELWIDVYLPGPLYDQLPGMTADYGEQGNFTLHSTANTSRGYFELGNEQNGNTHGPLLDQWPSYEEMINDFDDYLGENQDYDIATVNHVSPSSPSVYVA